MDNKDFWKIAKNMYMNKNYSNAINFFEKAFNCSVIQEDKNSRKNYIACCYIELEEYQKAIDILSELIVSEKWERPWFNLGRIYLKQNEKEKAFEYFNKALEISPEECDCHFYMGVFYEKNEEYRKAVEFYKRSAELAYDDYDESVAYLNMGRCLKRLGDYENAILYCDKSYQLDNTCYDALHNKAIIFIAMEKYQDAIDLFKYLYSKGNADDVKKHIKYCEYKIQTKNR